MIELTDVTKIYEGTPPITAVKNLSLAVTEGEVFGLIGTSGCGKTTTLKMINRLIQPTSGTIRINGEDVERQPVNVLRRSIGYVIQDVGLFPHYTIEQNIAVVPGMLGWDEEKIRMRSNEMLNLVGLEPEVYGSRKPAGLSGGQQQRAGLARALAADPPLILMDEPFGALDPITKEQVRIEFKQLLQRMAKTVVLVTHDVFEAFDLCDRICLLDRGRVQQTGTPKELLFHPGNGFVYSFFDNHRFQLEMTSITLKDLMDVINPGPVSSPDHMVEDGNKFEIRTSFLSVLEGADNKNHDEQIIVTDSRKNIVGRFTTGELLTAFQQVRMKFREESHG